MKQLRFNTHRFLSSILVFLMVFASCDPTHRMYINNKKGYIIKPVCGNVSISVHDLLTCFSIKIVSPTGIIIDKKQLEIDFLPSGVRKVNNIVIDTISTGANHTYSVRIYTERLSKEHYPTKEPPKMVIYPCDFLLCNNERIITDTLFITYSPDK